jgi:hypothetical protein
MYTTAALAIDDFTTELALTGDNWRPGQPRERVNVIPDDNGGSFRAAAKAEADRLLADRGYTRTSNWTYNAGRDAYLTALRTEEPK